MTRTTKNSAHVINTSVSSVYQESLSSEQESEMQDQSLQPSTSQAQFVPAMFKPYMDGPKMDQTVNDGLCHRFLKCKLECENVFSIVRLKCFLSQRNARKS